MRWLTLKYFATNFLTTRGHDCTYTESRRFTHRKDPSTPDASVDTGMCHGGCNKCNRQSYVYDIDTNHDIYLYVAHCIYNVKVLCIDCNKFDRVILITDRAPARAPTQSHEIGTPIQPERHITHYYVRDKWHTNTANLYDTHSMGLTRFYSKICFNDVRTCKVEGNYAHALEFGDMSVHKDRVTAGYDIIKRNNICYEIRVLHLKLVYENAHRPED